MHLTRHPSRNEPEEKWLIEPMMEVVTELQAQSAWTWTHLGRVARYAVAFGKRLGLSSHDMMTLQCAAILHDVGKLVVPNEILDKSSALTRDEWYRITKHSLASGQMLRWQRVPAEVGLVAQSHHEWYNGQGYPLGLQGESIPLGARILAIADAYDAMSSNRPYRAAMDPAEILAEFEKGAGTQFDPVVVHRLKPMLQLKLDEVTPRRRMRVVSDDPMLYQQLWFAAYPLGWEMAAWPEEFGRHCPPEMCPALPPARPDLTLVDFRSLRRLPEGVLDKLAGPVLWIDGVGAQGPAVFRPLDLQDLLPHLDPGDWRLDGQDAPTKSRVRVVVADPFKLFRQALATCFETRSDLQLVEAVDSPLAYRRVLRERQFDVAVVASDMLQGTSTTRPLAPGDALIGEQDTAAAAEMPTVVLVADEDLEGKTPPIWEPGQEAGSRRLFIPRGAPAELLVEAVHAVLRHAESETQAGQQTTMYTSDGGSDEQKSVWS
jgi:DNA-binding NarL/FixJ family response regulator